MSEKEVREALRKAKIRHLITECIDSSCPTCASIDEALDDEPDVVKMLRELDDELNRANVVLEEDNDLDYGDRRWFEDVARHCEQLIQWLQKQSHVCLTETGWEWTE